MTASALPPAEPFLSAEQVAEIFGMSRDWVYSRAAGGELPSYKLPGGKRRFLYSELLGSVRRYREGPSDDVPRLGR